MKINYGSVQRILEMTDSQVSDLLAAMAGREAGNILAELEQEEENSNMRIRAERRKQ